MNPIHLIKIEFLKYKDNSLVQMLLLFFTILMPTSIFVMKNMENIPMLPGQGSFFTFPTIWEYQAYAGSWLSFFFLGYLGVYIITSEIQFKTLRQNIITGMSRADFFLGKIYISLLVTIYATFVFFISTSIIGLLHQESFDFSLVFKEQNYVIIRFFLLTFAYISFGMLVAYIIRKPGLSMFFYFSYILFIEPLFRWWLHFKYIGKNNTMLYYPMNGIEDLAPLPFYKYAENFSPIKDFSILLSYNTAFLISIISVTVFVGLSYILLIKKDI